jgi:hypothetical protein
LNQEVTMSWYSLALFLHVVGALAVFAALGLEWAGIRGMGIASTPSQATSWTALVGTARRIGLPAMPVILATGIYLAVTRWGHQAWIMAGFAGLVVIAVLNVVLTGRRMKRLRRELAAAYAPTSTPAAMRLQDAPLRLAVHIKTGIGLGIIYVMSVKPDGMGAWTAMAIATVAGLFAGFVGSREHRGESLSGGSDLAREA